MNGLDPKASLDVVGDIKNTGNIITTGSIYGQYGAPLLCLNTGWENNKVLLNGWTEQAGDYTDLYVPTSATGVPQKYIRLTNQGYVGIGTPNPKNALDVNGTIRAKEILVTEADWADYVFDKDYKLPKLNDVEQFIQDNGHLPEIPSAADVKENGVNIVDVQAKLLQKVEEMTLYIIQQEKKMTQMQERLNKLEGGK